MKIELCCLGGYNEVGKNMTALRVNDTVIIFDMGFYMQKIVGFEEEKRNLTEHQLVKMDAIPDDSVIASWRDKVKGIFCSHAHLDHYGAVPYMASKYNCDVIGTPFTIEVLKTMVREDNLKMKNNTKVLNSGSKLKISEDVTVEFINVTHSTPQTVMIAAHTKRGVILYANDFKFDNHPVFGRKPNYDKLKEIGENNVIALVVDSLYSNAKRKTPSEMVAREMLRDVLFDVDNRDNAVIVTSFASNLARLKSVVDFGKKLDRKIVFLGRSLFKYCNAAQKIGLLNFSKEAEIISYGSKVRKKLKQIEKNRNKYLVVCTGGQGEPGSVLTRIATSKLPFNFKVNDQVIFSCKTIPVEPNIANKEELEKRLENKGVRIFKDIHSSGHCSREDLRDLINMVNPQNIIPAHGNKEKLIPMVELAEEMGYKNEKNVHLMSNGSKLDLSD